MPRRGATAALHAMSDYEDEMLDRATERFERRLAEECGHLRVEIASGNGEPIDPAQRAAAGSGKQCKYYVTFQRMTAEAQEFRSTRPFQEFFRTEAAGGALLVACACAGRGQLGVGRCLPPQTWILADGKVRRDL